MPGDGLGARAEAVEEPAAGRGRVGDGLDGGEGLGGDDEEGLGRVEVADRLVEVGAVDVGDETHRQVAVGEGAQHLVGHGGAEVGAADADVDDVPQRASGGAGPRAGAHLAGEVGHAVEDLVDLGNDVRAAGAAVLDDGAARGAERGVQDGAVLGGVDALAAVHRVAPSGHVGGLGQLPQQRQRLVGDELLGVVDVQVADAEGVPLTAVRVVGEELTQAHLAERRAVVGERGPLRPLGQPGSACWVHR